jgi:DNA-binding CsgD family transcriptional regulator/tetratricopeptide (TPR) repeat protein
VRAVADLVLDGRDVVIAGPGGIGKSTVARRAGELLAESGLTVRRISASPALTPVPLAAIAGLLEGATGGDLAAVALDSLRAEEHRNALPSGDGPGRFVLVIDDIDALDDGSATVIHQLATSGNVRLVLTMRSGSVRARSIDRVVDAPMITRVDVQPMEKADADELLVEMLGGQIESSTVVKLIEWSEGNPLHLIELVRGSLAAGSLSRHGSVWRLVDKMRPSPRLRELLTSRLAPLEPASLDALELLAVAGRIELQFATRLITSEVLEALERADLITVDAVGEQLFVDVAQASVRDVLDETIGALRRLRIFRTLAEHAAPPTDDEVDLQSMFWRVRGGVPTDPGQLLRAARAAMAASDTPLGAEFARAAARSTDDVEPVLIGCWCLSQLGRHDEAIADAEAALQRTTDPWALAVLHQRIAEELWWFRHDLERAEWHVSDQVGLPPGPWNELLQAQRGVFAILDGRVEHALEQCGPLSDSSDISVRFVAALGHALALSHTDSADAAIALSESLFLEASAAPDDERLTREPGIHLISQLIAMIYAGRYDEAAAAAEFVHDVALTLPGSQPRAWAATVRGFAMLFSGRPGSATRWFSEAEASWTDAALPGLARWVTSGLALAHGQTGAFDDARECLARVDHSEARGFRLYSPIESLARAWLADGEGRTRDAIGYGDEAIEAALSSGATALLALTAHDLARLNLRLAAKRAVGEFDGRYGAVISARLDFARALLDDDAERLVAAAEVWENLGAPLFAAEAFTAAAGLYRRAGRGRQRVTCEGRAGVLLAQCGPVSTPMLRVRSSVGPLSVREAEVAGLAASGVSSRDIADRLMIGERTVESHLYRIFLKLGVTSRNQLAEALTALESGSK